MRIDHTDENDAIIPRPESPAQEKAELSEDTSTWGILKSGWGLFFVVAGALSVVFDLSIPGDFPLFQGDSFTLGWIFIVGVLIVPAACTRHFGAAPINSALAVTWCIAGFVAWVVIHSIAAEVDPGKPVRPNLALLGGLILCWRLLTKPRQECPVSVTEEALVSVEGAQVSANAAVQAASSPAKIGLEHERQIKVSAAILPVEATLSISPDGMSDIKKRVLVGGLFVICAAVAIYALSNDDPPSLNWAVVLCGIWSAGIWQVPTRYFTAKKFGVLWCKIKFRKKRIAILSAILGLVIALLVFLVNSSKSQATSSLNNGWEIVKIGERDYVTADSIRNFYNPLYGFTTFRLDENDLLIGSSKLEVKAAIGSEEMLINNIKFILSFPVQSHKGKALFSRLDLCKLIDPVLCPSHIQNAEFFDTIVLDAGHGGHDVGARGVYGDEKDFTLKMAMSVRDALQDRGFKVVMTRTTDAFVTQEARVDIANAAPNRIFISIRFNTGDKTATGIETISLAPQECADDSVFQHGSSTALAVAVHASVISRFTFVDLGVKRAQTEAFEGCKSPGIIFKGGFISNEKECLLIASDTYRQEVSNAIADAVVNYRKAIESPLNLHR